MPLFIRKHVEIEVHERVAEGEPLAQTLTWLGKTGATVGEAIEMLEAAGVRNEDAKRALTIHPDWAPLISSMGGIDP